MATAIKSAAREDAARLLKNVWDGQIPVDPVAIAETYGIRVDDVFFKSDIAGALVKQPGRDPSIMLNARDSPNRKRFTCAHELGHFVRRSDQPDQYEYVDMRNSLSAEGFDEEEIYANEFAASLLMPEDEVRKLQAEGLTDVDMAPRFGVSRDAMAFRIKNLD